MQSYTQDSRRPICFSSLTGNEMLYTLIYVAEPVTVVILEISVVSFPLSLN